MNNKIIDLEFVTRVVEDLKNNPNAVTLEGGETKNGVFQMPFSITDETISKFFSSFYENELFDQNYLNNINKIENKDVEKLRPEEIFTYITFIHRQEHFSNGSLYGHFKSGLMLKLFIRLKELIELDSEVIKKVSNSFKLNKQIMESQNKIDQLLNDIDKKENIFIFNQDYNGINKSEKKIFTMTIEEIKEKIKREAVIFETGGIRPTNELGESWIGRVCWQYPGETEPISELGNKMIPIATIFIEGLDYIPESLKNVKMLNIFMDEDIWNNIRTEDYSKWFKINTYDELEKIVPCNYTSDKLNGFPLVAKHVNNDYPQWEDVDWDLCEVICELEKKEGINYYDDIYEENYSKHKIGGHPSSIQGGVGFDEGYEYVLQITSDSKVNFNIVDSGNFYFAYNPNLNKWSVRCDFY